MATEFPAALRRLWLVLKHHQCASLRPYLRTYSYCSCQFDHWSSDFQYDYHKSVASDISEFHQVVALLHSCCVYVAVISVWWWAVWWWSKWTLYLEPANFPRVVFQSFFAKSFAGVNPSGARVGLSCAKHMHHFHYLRGKEMGVMKGHRVAAISGSFQFRPLSRPCF